MTGLEIRDARATLGTLWGLGRPLRAAELARLLGLQSGGNTVLQWEKGTRAVSGPVAIAIWYMLQGGPKPPTYTDSVW
jgi:hypothetical protein